MPRISGMDMLKAVVTDLNTVDEAHRAFYVERNGKFYVNITPVEGFELDNVQGLKTALGAERNNVAVLKEQIKPYEGLDAAAARTALERITAFGDITPDAAKTAVETAARLTAFDPAKEADKIANTKLETLKGQLQAQFTLRETELLQQVKGAEGTVTSLTGQLQTLVRDNEIKSELAKLNPLDDARDAIELLAGKSVRTQNGGRESRGRGSRHQRQPADQGRERHSLHYRRPPHRGARKPRLHCSSLKTSVEWARNRAPLRRASRASRTPGPKRPGT